ncbi:CaiB/BaiF CoA transferase family protein [Microcella frigidaquae]|uniref:Crotonobetainyl-CoA:carnitine CoA-transferase CaiB-like acyl-CoA transferase n=1 Tax=Microcella frigidaquae TaxID=424758 RepID=A0A840XJ38_9MICO|nr:CoA transferase [Microcella frigidaquae]MBB5616877.1 crotonobetainyl-CoA:carnitine CoA-transferase CaiB-like acyl-CoA transferase [Microcella frigidaquae]NHN43684.1 CoA transferase [Microcella frigidaquae]
MIRPLDGMLVADLSRVLAGPTAAVMLADLGARVVKVERPGAGDDTRAWGPPWAGSSSAYFESANRSKQSIALDFGDPDDLATARALVDRADVVIENYRTGALERFGLDAVSVRARNPRAVYCSITGFGSTGEGASMPGYDFLVQALGGLMSITGDAGGEPRKVGVAMVDLLAANHAVMGVLAALLHRERAGGEGQHVEVSLMGSLLASLANQASSYLTTGQSPRALGNRHPSIAPYETLRCRDGMLAVAVGNDAQFAALCRELGSPELASDPRFATNPARVAHRDQLEAALEALLAADDAAAWAARLLAVGVPAGTVNGIGEALALARRLGLAPTVAVGEGHPEQLAHPVRYSAFAPVVPTAPPALDEHGAALRAWLAEG